MSVSFEEALRIAKEWLPDGLRLTAAYEGQNNWFFGVGDSVVDATPGLSPLVINKQTGNTSNPMPNIPYFVSGRSPLPIEQESFNAVKVNLSEQ